MKYIKIFLFFIFFISGNALGADNKQTNSGDINFSSEKLKVDEKTKIMIASGNVIITNNNRQLTADKVEYDQTQTSNCNRKRKIKGKRRFNL
jgi:lipopolysaccharide assembly outer membrane protein LptD (OstA)